MPFKLGVGLLSRVFGGSGDKIGARAMLIAGPAGAAPADVWMALGEGSALMLGVLGPMPLLGLSFAVLVAPLTAAVMSSVDQTEEGLASGITNAASRIAQLAGVALAASAASFGLATKSASSWRRDRDRRRLYGLDHLDAGRGESGRLGRGLERMEFNHDIS